MPALPERGRAGRALVESLRFSPLSGNANIKRASIGQGAVLVGDDLRALLDAAGARREPAIDTGLKLVRRRERDGVTYFIVNGRGMGERRVKEAQTASAEMDSYVRSVAGSGDSAGRAQRRSYR